MINFASKLIVMDNNAEKEKEELIELFGIHFEKFHVWRDELGLNLR